RFGGERARETPQRGTPIRFRAEDVHAGQVVLAARHGVVVVAGFHAQLGIDAVGGGAALRAHAAGSRTQVDELGGELGRGGAFGFESSPAGKLAPQLGGEDAAGFGLGRVVADFGDSQAWGGLASHRRVAASNCGNEKQRDRYLRPPEAAGASQPQNSPAAWGPPPPS